MTYLMMVPVYRRSLFHRARRLLHASPTGHAFYLLPSTFYLLPSTFYGLARTIGAEAALSV